jgi:uncharacterized protein YciI
LCAFVNCARLSAQKTVQSPHQPGGGSEGGASDVTDAALFLYKIQPVRPEMLSVGPTPEEEQAVSEHFAYLENLTEAGVVLLAGRTLNTDHSSFGIVILTARSEQAARDIMLNDPAISQRVMRAELYPYRIALLGTLPKL